MASKKKPTKLSETAQSKKKPPRVEENKSPNAEQINQGGVINYSTSKPPDITKPQGREEVLLHEQASSPSGDLETLSPKATKQLLYELRSQQAELERQNEELRRTQTELDTLRARYFDLYDLAPVGYCTVNEKGLIQQANHCAATQLGVEQKTLIPQSFSRFVFREDEDLYYAMRKQLISTREPQSCELRMMKKDGTLIWIHLATSLVQDADSPFVWRVIMTDITERKLAEEQLRESQNILQSTIESPKDVNIVSIDRQYQYLNFNTFHKMSMKQTYGVDIKKGMNILECISSQNARKTLKASFDKAFTGENISVVEKSGSTTLSYWETKYSPIVNSQHEIIGATAFSLNITERKLAEARLAESEQHFRAIFEQFAVGVSITDARTKRFLHLNQKYCEIIGYSPDEVMNLTFVDITHPDDLPADLDKMGRLLRGEISNFSMEKRYYRKDGTLVWVNLTVSPLWVTGQQTEEMTQIGIIEDITERKRTEEALEQSENRLLQAQKILGLGIWDWDITSDVTVWSGEMFNIYGITPETFTGKGGDYINFTHPEDRAIQVANIQKSFQRAAQREDLAQAFDGTWGNLEFDPHQFRIIRPDGSLCWVEGDAVAVVNEAGNPIKMIGVLVDITARKEAEEALRASEHLVRGIADNIPGLVAYWNRDLRCIFANKEYFAWFGYTEEQMRGITIQEFMGKELLQKNEPYIRAVLRGEDQQFERTLTKFNGEIVYTWAQYIADQLNGEVHGFFVLVTDITAIKKGQEQLHASELKWHSLFEILPVGVSLMDASHTITDFNPALSQILDISKEGLLSGDYRGRKYLRPDNTPMYAEDFPSIRAVKEQKSIQNIEIGVQKENGVIIWTSVNAMPLPSGVGIVTVTTDITARKQAEEALRKHEANLNALISNTQDRIWAVDTEYRLIISNTQHIEGLQESMKHGIAIGENVLPEEIPPEFRNEWRRYYDRALHGETFSIESKMQFVEKPRYTEFSFHPIQHPNGSITGVVVSGHDITVRKQSEETLRESEAKLRKAQHYARMGSWTWNLKTDELDWSDEMYAILGVDKQTFSGLLSDVIAEAIHPEDRAKVEQSNDRVIRESKPIPLEYRIVWRDGTVRIVWAEAGELILDNMGNPSILIGTLQDITERKQAEEQLRQQAIWSQFISDAVITTDLNLLITGWNEGATRIYGWNASEAIGQRVDVLLNTKFVSVAQSEAQDILNQSSLWQGQIRQKTKSGQWIDLDVAVTYLRDHTGMMTGGITINRDITERMRTAELVKTSLQEKEVLLKEIHHRVKNNLQVISSLLYLQSRNCKDEETQALFLESENRITSMALIHEKLYQSTDLAHISFEEYTHDLVRALFQSYGVDESNISLLIEANGLTLEINNAVPCGLIINEIVSNSLKYAFPENSPGVICIALSLETEKRFGLVISDDGVGLPSDFQQRAASSLGTKLIERLVEQIQGKLERSSSSQGTHYFISFPNKEG